MWCRGQPLRARKGRFFLLAKDQNMGLARRFKRLGTQGHARLEVRSHRHHRHHRIGQLTLREGQLVRPGKDRGCVHIRAHPQNQHIERQIRRNLLR